MRRFLSIFILNIHEYVILDKVRKYFPDNPSNPNKDEIPLLLHYFYFLYREVLFERNVFISFVIAHSKLKLLYCN